MNPTTFPTYFPTSKTMFTQSTIPNWLFDKRTLSISDTPTHVSLYSDSAEAVLSTANN